MIFAPRLAAAIETLDPTIEELPPEVKPLRSQMSIVSSLDRSRIATHPTRRGRPSDGDLSYPLARYPGEIRRETPEQNTSPISFLLTADSHFLIEIRFVGADLVSARIFSYRRRKRK